MFTNIPFKSTAFAGAILLNAPVHAAIIAFEAESGTLDSDLTTTSDTSASGGTYIEALTDGGGGAPMAGRSASYTVTLAAATSYNFFVRYYVGPGGGGDDSFFAGNGFGAKAASTGNDWTEINNLAAGTGSNELLDPEGNNRVNGAYRWVNLSTQTNASENVGTYTSGATGTEIFQIAAREDGLRLDAFAFVTTDETPSTAQLNSALIPEPSSAALLALGSLALLRRRR